MNHSFPSSSRPRRSTSATPLQKMHGRGDVFSSLDHRPRPESIRSERRGRSFKMVAGQYTYDQSGQVRPSPLLVALSLLTHRSIPFHSRSLDSPPVLLLLPDHSPHLSPSIHLLGITRWSRRISQQSQVPLRGMELEISRREESRREGRDIQEVSSLEK